MSSPTEVRVSRFLPSQPVRSEQRNLGPPLLAEGTMFLAERFPSIQYVHFTLTREIEMHGDGTMVAAARVELLRSIGATDALDRSRTRAGPATSWSKAFGRTQSTTPLLSGKHWRCSASSIASIWRAVRRKTVRSRCCNAWSSGPARC